jgi:single-stranded DNA-binding protein
LHNRSYEKDGQKNYTMDLVVTEFTPIVEMKTSEACRVKEGRDDPPPQAATEPPQPRRPMRTIEDGNSRPANTDSPPCNLRF